MSIPEATPAEVITPSSTTREARSTVTPASSEPRRSREAQWVVARRPWRRPALASRREPVQTEVTWRAAAAVRRIQSRVSSSLSSRRVPNPPGTTRRSIRGASAKPWRGTTVSPPVAVMGSWVRATVKTWNGAPSSERRASTPGWRRVREKTSKGPAKSSTSTLSKSRMPTLRVSMAGLLPGTGSSLKQYNLRAGGNRNRSARLFKDGHGRDLAAPRALCRNCRSSGRADRPRRGGAVDRRRGAAGARSGPLAGPAGRDGRPAAPPSEARLLRSRTGRGPHRLPGERGGAARQRQGLLRPPQQPAERGARPRLGDPYPPGARPHGGRPPGRGAARRRGVPRALPAAPRPLSAAPLRPLRPRPAAHPGRLPGHARPSERRRAGLRSPPAQARGPAPHPDPHAQQSAADLPPSRRDAALDRRARPRAAARSGGRGGPARPRAAVPALGGPGAGDRGPDVLPRPGARGARPRGDRGVDPGRGQAARALAARSERLHPLHLPFVAAPAQGEADAQLPVVGIEDVLAVGRAVHPGAHHLIHRELPLGDVLADRPPVVAGGAGPLAHGLPLGALVGEVVAGQHVLGVALGRLVEAIVRAQGGHAGLLPLGVDRGEDRGAHPAQVTEPRGAAGEPVRRGFGHQERIEGSATHAVDPDP